MAQGGDSVTVHGAIVAQAARAPHSIAVSGAYGRLSFGELERASGALAASLVDTGVRRGDLVLVRGRVSPELMVAVVGIMRAGAAYVPLDVRDLSRRARRIVTASQAKALVDCEAVEPGVDPVAGALLRVPVILEELLDAGAPGAPEVSSAPQDLAYVLFTSGTTGEPKGVMVEHRSVVNYASWVAQVTAVDGRCPPLPALTRFAFDASVQETIAPLMRGDRIWVLPDGITREPEALLAKLRATPFTGLHCVPSLWEELLVILERTAQEPPRLSALFLGGERMRSDLWWRTQRMLPDCELAIVYGPTEATVQITGGFQRRGESPTVGRPALGVSLRVVAGDGRPLDDGAVGELEVSGVCLARGYLADPELTARRFPTREDGVRSYRTGDLGRLRRDGEVEILGRIDEQTKVRGYRVDLLEIDSVLSEHPGVERACCEVAESDSSHARLRALVVAAGDHLGGDAGLRAFAAERLPEHLVPTEYLVVEHLPTLANGKLDRRAAAACRAPAESSPTRATSPLAEVWAEVLEIDHVGDDTDFFAAGGHSLLVARVTAKTRKLTQTQVPMRLLFDNPRFGDFAAQIALLPGNCPAAVPASAGKPVPPASAADRLISVAAPYPLSAQQRQSYVSDIALAQTIAGVAVVPLDVVGAHTAGQLRRSLERLLERHEALRSVYVDIEDQPMQAVLPAPQLELVEIDGGAWSSPAAEAARVVLAEAHRGFDLRTECPLRGVLIGFGDLHSLLALLVHHAFCDGTSMGVLVSDLAAIHGGAEMPDPPTAMYGHYAAWQRARLSAGAYDDAAKRIASRVRKPFVPSGLIDAPQQLDRRSFRFSHIERRHDDLDRESVGRLAAAHGVTTFMVTLAALAYSVRDLTHTEQVRFGSLTAGRDHPAAESLVGSFATTTLLDIDTAGDFVEVLDRTRAAVLDVLADDGLPIGAALELAEGREVRADIFEIGFTEALATSAWTAGEVMLSVHRLGLAELPELVLPSSTPLAVTSRFDATEMILEAEFERDRVPQQAVTHLLDATLQRLCDELKATVTGLLS